MSFTDGTYIYRWLTVEEQAERRGTSSLCTWTSSFFFLHRLSFFSCFLFLLVTRVLPFSPTAYHLFLSSHFPHHLHVCLQQSTAVVSSRALTQPHLHWSGLRTSGMRCRYRNLRRKALAPALVCLAAKVHPSRISQLALAKAGSDAASTTKEKPSLITVGH